MAGIDKTGGPTNGGIWSGAEPVERRGKTARTAGPDEGGTTQRVEGGYAAGVAGSQEAFQSLDESIDTIAKFLEVLDQYAKTQQDRRDTANNTNMALLNDRLSKAQEAADNITGKVKDGKVPAGFSIALKTAFNFAGAVIAGKDGLGGGARATAVSGLGGGLSGIPDEIRNKSDADHDADGQLIQTAQGVDKDAYDTMRSVLQEGLDALGKVSNTLDKTMSGIEDGSMAITRNMA